MSIIAADCIICFIALTSKPVGSGTHRPKNALKFQKVCLQVSQAFSHHHTIKSASFVVYEAELSFLALYFSI